MTTETKYEYHVLTKDDDLEELHRHVQGMADQGWEMVSGAATSWVGESSEWPNANVNVWHTKYVTYWRRPITPTDAKVRAVI